MDFRTKYSFLSLLPLSSVDKTGENQIAIMDVSVFIEKRRQSSKEDDAVLFL